MLIFVYSETTEADIAASLGRPDYSYYFILRAYMPVLEEIGEVEVLDSLNEESLAQVNSSAESSGDSIFLCFTPPHRVPRNLACRTVCVMAWEFDTIPYERWNSPTGSRSWVEILNEIGEVVTISRFAAEVLRNHLDPHVNVHCVPAPLDEDTSPSISPGQRLRYWFGALGRHPELGHREITLSGKVLDSRTLDINSQRVLLPDMVDTPGDGGLPTFSGASVTMFFNDGKASSNQYLIGFYPPETWGTWSRIDNPEIMLPFTLEGSISLEIEACAYGENIGRLITLCIGEDRHTLLLSEKPETLSIELQITSPQSRIRFENLVASPVPGARDHRTLGIGLKWLRVHGQNYEMHDSADTPSASQDAEARLSLEGPVFTSVFNPEDGRKNWPDMVTAFVWAFKDTENATLLLKMSHSKDALIVAPILSLMSQLHPFKCRIVVVYRYLKDSELQSIRECSTYIVNSSRAEGQCLPLIEFMANGVPAVSPDHTAMQDYIDSGSALIVASSKQPQNWPVDPRAAYRATSYRISWWSLVQAFESAYAIALTQPRRYRRMSGRSKLVVLRRFSQARAKRRLKGILYGSSLTKISIGRL